MATSKFGLTDFPSRIPSAIRHGEACLSDKTLIAEVCLGSREELATLFRRYARLVRGIALRVVRDASEADDLSKMSFSLFTASPNF